MLLSLGVDAPEGVGDGAPLHAPGPAAEPAPGPAPAPAPAPAVFNPVKWLKRDMRPLRASCSLSSCLAVSSWVAPVAALVAAVAVCCTAAASAATTPKFWDFLAAQFRGAGLVPGFGGRPGASRTGGVIWGEWDLGLGLGFWVWVCVCACGTTGGDTE